MTYQIDGHGRRSSRTGARAPARWAATLTAALGWFSLCLPSPLPAQTSSEALAGLFADVDAADDLPQDSLYRGFHPRGPWASYADSAQRRRAGVAAGFAERLGAIDTAGLSRQEQISAAVMRLRLADEVDGVRYRMHLIPMNAEGGFYNRLSYVLPRLPFETPDDYRAYLTWLPHYRGGLRQNLGLLRRGLAEGIVAPRPVVTNALALLRDWAVDDVRDSPLYTPFEALPAGFSESEKGALREEAATVIGDLNAAYRELSAFLEDEYAPSCPELPGVGQLPGGADYYANRVRHYTTLPLSVDAVHALGLSEVARIRAAMDEVMARTGFAGDFADFLSFLRTDERFYAQTPEELLRRAAWISKRAEGELPRYFRRLYRLPFTVAPVPADIAPTYTGGRYVGGSAEEGRAGTYWVNTYDLPSRTLYTLPALSLHEAVPGHHLQGALAAELEGLPRFRKTYYISAFGEGWGLYSEYLGEEMGMYETDYELFGRYTYEMWRACRLVIDTGLHAQGWTRQRALDYLAANTALSLREVETEVDRYIGWPGQALSYKVGELEIKRLRAEAEATLGADFDVRDFHEAVLRNGSIPLSVLREEVGAYVRAALAE